MITTTYKCDRCGHEQNDNKQMWEVAVSVQHLDSTTRVKREFHYLSKHTPIWCRACIDALGLLSGWKPLEDASQTVAPTLEDQIREVIRDEIEAATGGRV